MRLSRVKLSGFKSFVDPTTIHFPGSLIGVVGPNGCGKSNVIDAVRWVMGESSAKYLRGDTMSDVIFNGSNTRKPVGNASIELVFDNDEGSFGGEYANYNEIAIQRQVTRDGQSVYSINGTRCRRRDITDIFLGTGLGPRSYSIIEQGMISRLIEARPEELRVYLEEAAGISKYKERRKETENRIRRSRENLERLDDLVEEIEKQLNHLQRQSKAAGQYKELKHEERRVRAELLALRYLGLQESAAEQKHQLREKETAMEAAIAQQRATESEIEKARADSVESNESFNKVQGRYYEAGAEIARTEQAIQHSKETRESHKAELEEALKVWQELQDHIEADTSQLQVLGKALQEQEPALDKLKKQEASSTGARDRAEEMMQEWQLQWEQCNENSAGVTQRVQVRRTTIDHLEREIGQLSQRLERVEAERKTLASQDLEKEIKNMALEAGKREKDTVSTQRSLDELHRRVEDTQEQIDDKNERLDEARSQQQDLRGRLASLEALQQAALGQQEGEVTSWLRSRDLHKASRLAQEIQVEKGWEQAVETVLGFYLEAVCTDSVDKVASVLDGLEHGAVALFDTSSGVRVSDSGKSGGAPLADKVHAPWSLAGIMSGVYVADSLAKALKARAGLAPHESIVTKDGIWMGTSWLRVAKDPDEKTGVLGRTQEIKELGIKFKAESRNVEALQKSLEKTRSELHEIEGRKLELQEEVNSAHRLEAESRAQLGARESRMEQLRSRSVEVAQDSEEIKAQISQSKEELSSSRTSLDELLAQMEVFLNQREELAGKRNESRSLLDNARQQARDDRDASHELALTLESTRTGKDQIQQSLERMESQQKHLSQRREDLQTALALEESPIEDLAKELEQMLVRRLDVENELKTARATLDAIEERLRVEEQKRTTHERDAQAIREALEQDRIAFQEVKVRSQTFLEQLAETDFELELLQQEMPKDAELEKWEHKAEKIAQRIGRLGPINLAAIEEYQEQLERKQYLDSQHEDVTAALDLLEKAIKKIDKETRTRFKDTFDKVNAGLQRMFPRLFGGGSAYLELTGEDMLDTGVTVMARPPGKRNSTIHLLSGGEKALTAVALVFSIFELNPSPFCMLDEVDAPLDDANVGRYCELVREMSEHVQFIFITHNKITMEMANQLTGVTMSEPGVSRLVAVDIDQAVQMVVNQ